VDKDIGDRIEQGVRAKASEKDPTAENRATRRAPPRRPRPDRRRTGSTPLTGRCT
jgi:hypothetical protein